MTLFFLVVVVTCVQIIVAYETYARGRGLPVGTLFIGDASILKIISILVGIVALLGSFFLYRWYSPILILVISFTTGPILTNIFRDKVQIISVLGMIAGIIGSLLTLNI